MAEPLPLTAHLYFDAETGEEERRSLTDGLAGLGLETYSATLGAFRGETLTWLVLVVLPLSGFLQNVGQILAQDACTALKRILGGALRRSPGEPPAPPRPLLLEDTRSATRILVEADLPVAAYQQLLELDLQSCTGRTLSYDRERNCWSGPGPRP
ncbi:hypothetical protein FGW37_29680 [Streptomyces rectiverticillatus]|uniref:hypothetical protein n=1 Tax=Streptomyces rectiverticillatus TaxID=173860 RepID=UPI0015C3EF66|nr:hypothetical protein [Streptomyces rectiverticillatus]QLE75220.1 hypothetical protein FGW37_29680 [Streptomyces rectiverticillatus]